MNEQEVIINLKAKCFDLIEENKTLNNLINQVAQNLNVTTAEEMLEATKLKGIEE